MKRLCLLLGLLVSLIVVSVNTSANTYAYTPSYLDGLTITSTSKQIVNTTYEHTVVYSVDSSWSYMYLEFNGYGLYDDYNIINYRIVYHQSTDTSRINDVTITGSCDENFGLESSIFDWNYDRIEIVLIQPNTTNYTITYDDYIYINTSVEMFTSYLNTIEDSDLYKQGYNAGYSVGLTDGASSGYSDGYATGYDVGYEYGSNDTESPIYDVAYDNGYSVGYNIGVVEGYDNGYADGGGYQHDVDYFFKILSFLVGFFINLLFFFFTIEVYGVSVIAFIELGATIVVVAWVLRIIRGS